MIDGNLSMANAYTEETEQQNSYWADVHSLFEEMDKNIVKYSFPISPDYHKLMQLIRSRKERLKAIAERYVRMKYYPWPTRKAAPCLKLMCTTIRGNTFMERARSKPH